MYRPYCVAKAIYGILLALIFVIPIGCGADRQTDGDRNHEDDLMEGWKQYMSGNCESAILSFESVLNRDAPSENMADAYNGIGWAYTSISRDAGINRANISIALEKFQIALDKDPSNSDAWVGMASMLIVRRNSGDDLNRAVTCINKALEGNAGYMYRHDYDSEADLYALKAQCYYFMGNLDSAKSEITRCLEIDKGNESAMILQAILGM